MEAVDTIILERLSVTERIDESKECSEIHSRLVVLKSRRDREENDKSSPDPTNATKDELVNKKKGTSFTLLAYTYK